MTPDTDTLPPLPEPIGRHDGQPLFGSGQMRAYAAAAVAAERERCAKLCESLEGPGNPPNVPNGYSCAAAIRSPQHPTPAEPKETP